MLKTESRLSAYAEFRPNFLVLSHNANVGLFRASLSWNPFLSLKSRSLQQIIKVKFALSRRAALNPSWQCAKQHALQWHFSLYAYTFLRFQALGWQLSVKVEQIGNKKESRRRFFIVTHPVQHSVTHSLCINHPWWTPRDRLQVSSSVRGIGRTMSLIYTVSDGGRNGSSWRKPTQGRGEHAKSIKTGPAAPQLGIKCRSFMLWSDGANRWAAVLPHHYAVI